MARPMTRNQTLHEKLIPLLARGMGVRRYLELGCHENQTLGPVSRAVDNATVIGVDCNEPTTRVPGVQYRIMTTSDYLAGPAATDGPFDMAFIDADHSARAVLADFYGLLPHMADDGVILLHDGNPETVDDTAPGLCGSGWLAIKTITETHEAVTLPYHPGLTIVRKRVRWGPTPAPATEERT